MDVSFTLSEIEERDKVFEVAAQPGRDKISVCTCTGFCLRETERNACPCRSAQQFCTSSCHLARGTTSLWMITHGVLQEDSSENDEVLKSLFFPRGKVFAQLQTCTLLCFYYCREDNIPTCEAHKQFGAEPAHYGLEISFKLQHVHGVPTPCLYPFTL